MSVFFYNVHFSYTDGRNDVSSSADCNVPQILAHSVLSYGRAEAVSACVCDMQIWEVSSLRGRFWLFGATFFCT